MKYTHRSIAIPLLLVVALLTTACPSSSSLDRMAKASRELAADTLLANKIVGEFYTAGKIPLPKKDIIAQKLGVIGNKGEAFNNTLIALDAKYPQGTVPPSDLVFIRANLSELKVLYSAVLADLLPFNAQKAVTQLGQHLEDIQKAVN